MATGARGGGRPSGNGVRGYTLRGKNGKINYVGTTNNPSRRAAEHQAEGKPGTLQTETRPMPRQSAEQWETNRLKIYREHHGGKNPPGNKTKNGTKNG